MKMSQKALEYILLLLIVAIAFCAYRFGYKNFKDKADAVRAENKQIQARIDELNAKLAMQETYEKGIVDYAKEVKDVLKKYGPGNQPEKSIMFVRELEDASLMTIPNISFNPDENIFASTATDENGSPRIQVYNSQLALTYSATYDGLKAAFDFINQYPERMNVRAFNVAGNQESGALAGSLVINLFSAKDEDHVYESPYVGAIDLGTENIFGMGNVFPTVEGMEGAEEGEGAGAAEGAEGTAE